MFSVSQLTIKQRLNRLGFTVHRVLLRGDRRGMEIRMGGVKVHNTPVASADYAIELCEKMETKND